MSAREPEQISQIVQEIERYWEHNPEAADTLDSIVRWWLSRQRIEESVHLVARALLELTQRGWVEVHTTPDGRRVYRRTKRSQ